MKTNKKIKTILLLLLGGSFLFYIGNFFFHAVIELSKNPMTSEKNIPDDYMNLFNKTAKQKLSLDLGTSFKLRNNISVLSYDKKYHIELTRINTVPGLKFGNDIIEEYTKAEGNLNGSEWSFNETNFVTKYKGTSTGVTSKIYLSLYGDSVRTILKNDTIAYYYLKLKDVYLQYDRRGSFEISVEAKTKGYFFQVKQPISLMFVKKGNKLYFLLLTINDGTEKLDPDLLYKLISKE